MDNILQSRQPFGTARFAPHQLLQEQKAARYRRHAEKFRELASAAPLPAAAGALLDLARDYDLDVKLVSYGSPSQALLDIARNLG